MIEAACTVVRVVLRRDRFCANTNTCMEIRSELTRWQ